MWRKNQAGACLGLLTAILMICAAPSGATELHFANEHWPPFIIMDEAGPARGIDVDLVTELAARMGLVVEISKCDWFYCLKMMQNGRVDIISATLKRPDREKYMLFVEPPYLKESTKLFYLSKGKGNLVRDYTDLYRFTIGVLKGSAYFSTFDGDTRIRKVEVLKTEQLLEMLKEGRIDAMIGTEIVTDYLIRAHRFEGLFSKSIFRHTSEAPFHLAISKKSPFSRRIEEFNRMMTAMIAEGQVAAILLKYRSGSP